MATNRDRLDMMNVIIAGTDKQIERYFSRTVKKGIVEDTLEPFPKRKSARIVEQEEIEAIIEDEIAGNSVVAQTVRIGNYSDTYISAKYKTLAKALTKNGIPYCSEDSALFCKLEVYSTTLIAKYKQNSRMTIQKVMQNSLEYKYCWIMFEDGAYTLYDDSGEVYVSEVKELQDMMDFMKIHYTGRMANGLLITNK